MNIREPSSKSCARCGIKPRRKSHAYCLECHAEYMRNNRPKHSELQKEQKKKAICRAYANTYLSRGKIQKKQCEKCGDDNTQMHHDDYDKPLKIIWLCRKCHLEHHKEMVI